MNTTQKFLLVRAEFVLDRSRGGDRLMFKRWRRALAEVFPRLLGYANRCDRTAVRLHYGEEEGRFTGWLRLPVERLPNRRHLHDLKAKLCDRFETALLAVGGDVIKFSIRRSRVNKAIVSEPLGVETSAA